jgi:hypothetical protein
MNTTTSTTAMNWTNTSDTNSTMNTTAALVVAPNDDALYALLAIVLFLSSIGLCQCGRAYFSLTTRSAKEKQRAQRAETNYRINVKRPLHSMGSIVDISVAVKQQQIIDAYVDAERVRRNDSMYDGAELGILHVPHRHAVTSPLTVNSSLKIAWH